MPVRNNVENKFLEYLRDCSMETLRTWHCWDCYAIDDDTPDMIMLREYVALPRGCEHIITREKEIELIELVLFEQQVLKKPKSCE